MERLNQENFPVRYGNVAAPRSYFGLVEVGTILSADSFVIARRKMAIKSDLIATEKSRKLER